MSDNGELEDKPPAPPVRMSSTIFSTGGKDPLSANHSLKPLPSVPEEKKPRNKIISIFSGTEKDSNVCTAVPALLLHHILTLRNVYMLTTRAQMSMKKDVEEYIPRC